MLYNHNARKGAATTSQNFTVVEFDALQLSNNGTANLHDPPYTSHSAYVATETELVVAKIDGLLPPNFL